MPESPTDIRRWIAPAFFLSGLAALIYQIAWQRVLTQVIGSDAVAITFIVTLFMLWLGVGAEIARRLIGSRMGRNALQIYAAIEFSVGLYGAASVYLLREGNAWLATGHTTGVVTDLLFNGALLALPIIGMGMTTPLIIHLVKHKLDDLGRTVGYFYGLNILGAAAGAVLAGFLLIELVGLFGTVLIAAVINLGIGIFFLRLARHWKQPKAVRQIKREAPRHGFTLAAVTFGFGTLAIQILFIRVLTNYFTMSPLVFPVIIGVYLLLMAAGQNLGGRIADRYPQMLAQAVAMLFAAGAVLIAAALLFPPTAAASFDVLRFTTFNGTLIATEHGELIGDGPLISMALFAAFIMLAVVPWSALFTVMLRLATRRIEQAGAQFASLYVAYTIGNVLGSLICGLYLLEHFGTAHTAQIIILLVGLGALPLLWRADFERSRLGGAYALAALAALLIPSAYYKHFHLGDYAISKVHEGRNGVVSVVPTHTFYTILDMNRTASGSALNREPVAPDDQYEAWRWNHTDLLALDPAFRPKHILIIGLGHAYLIDALLDLPSVDKIVVVELSQEMLSAVREETKTGTARIFTDPRVEIVIGDGRRYVQKALAAGERFDLIQTKINEPWHAGAGNLFTREFFAAQRALLNPGGYLGVRPLLGHLNDGLAVFHAAIWPGYYHLYFPKDPKPFAQRALITSDIAAAWKRVIPNGASGPRDKTTRVAYFTQMPENLAVAPNTDNHPNFEYSWLRDHREKSYPMMRTNLDRLALDKYIATVPVVYGR